VLPLQRPASAAAAVVSKRSSSSTIVRDLAGEVVLFMIDLNLKNEKMNLKNQLTQ
jgi:hypothetical protein